MTLRAAALLTHRWMGLASACVLAIVGGTGAVLIWPGRFPGRGLVGALHDSLALGSIGRWIVLSVTAAAVLLQLSGLYLWWRRKTLRVSRGRGWKRMVLDLHNAFGAVAFALMFVLAATGLGRPVARFFDPANIHREVRTVIVDLHDGKKWAVPVKVLYAAASAGFVVQAVTGVMMWWRPRRQE